MSCSQKPDQLSPDFGFLFSKKKALGNKTIPYWGVVVTGEAEGEQEGGKTTTASFSCVEALIKTCEDPWKKKSVQIL